MQVLTLGWAEFLKVFFGRAGASGDVVAPVMLALLGGYIVMKISAGALRAGEPGWGRVAIAAAPIVALMVVALGVLRAFAFSGFVEQHEALVMVAACVLVVLAVAVPVQCAVLRTGYIAGVLTWVFATLAAAAVFVAVNGVIGMVKSGDRDLEKVKGRRNTVDKFLNQ